jgi:hypothetical protein
MSSQDDLLPRHSMNRHAFVSCRCRKHSSPGHRRCCATRAEGPKRGPCARAVRRRVKLVRGDCTIQAAGRNATVVKNPLTTPPEAVASAERVLARLDGPTILVGRSFSGKIVTEAGMHPNLGAGLCGGARASCERGLHGIGYDISDASAGIVFDGDEGRLCEAGTCTISRRPTESGGEGPLCGPTAVPKR